MRLTTEEEGSVLAMVPAATLVLFLLSSLTVDAAATFLAQRQLADLCAGAANDAATIGLRASSLAQGNLEIDAQAARAVVEERLADPPEGWRRPVAVDVELDPADAHAGLRVRLRADAPVPMGLGAGRHRSIVAECHVVVERR